MTAFKEGFDESRFREFQKTIKENYSGFYPNPDEIFDRCEQAFVARGDDGHIKFVRDFIFKSFENPDLQVRRAAANWISGFREGTYGFGSEADPTVVLVSCSTGKTPDGIAQAIADLGARVIAPNQDTNIEKFAFEKSEGQLTLNASYRYPTQAKLFYPKPERKTS